MQKNPLKEFIDDKQYEKLKRMGLINHRAVRDYYIRKKFKVLRGELKPKQIVEDLKKEFPYLTKDSIRKIAYSKEED